MSLNSIETGGSVPPVCEVVPASDGDWDIRILRRVCNLERMRWPLMTSRAPMDETRFVGVVDCETTSIDPRTASVIDLALCVLDVDASGRILGMAEYKQGLRDPGCAIPPEITRLPA